MKKKNEFICILIIILIIIIITYFIFFHLYNINSVFLSKKKYKYNEKKPLLTNKLHYIFGVISSVNSL